MLWRSGFQILAWKPAMLTKNFHNFPSVTENHTTTAAFHIFPKQIQADARIIIISGSTALSGSWPSSEASAS
jgi:hypothetical protein